MKGLCTAFAVAAVVLVAECMAKEPPTQVIYRFDDYRYLELKGWDCEGELWYTDIKRGIHTQPASQFYRIFTRKFIHPSEKYIAITNWEVDGFLMAKHGGLLALLPVIMNLMGITEHQPKTRCRLPSSMIRVFCKLNTGFICRQSRSMTHALSLGAPV